MIIMWWKFYIVTVLLFSEVLLHVKATYKPLVLMQLTKSHDTPLGHNYPLGLHGECEKLCLS